MKLNEYPLPKVGEIWAYNYGPGIISDDPIIIKEVLEDKIVYTWPNTNSWTHTPYDEFFRSFVRLKK